jgi:hypothetical protein
VAFTVHLTIPADLHAVGLWAGEQRKGRVSSASIADGPILGTGFALRRVVVAPNLGALSGPLTGQWQLPLHLDASARVVFDFSVAPPSPDLPQPTRAR